MTTFTQRTTEQKNIIRKAYDFEIEAIANCDSSRNPWFDTITAMPDGDILWEAINVAVEMACGNE